LHSLYKYFLFDVVDAEIMRDDTEIMHDDTSITTLQQVQYSLITNSVITM
jgi:hypothetical protein